ncbi:hypothetical protein QJS10_CPB20g01061 [Acorus calamus]|uniref:Uncharacterized protein n=1 Tax=Acorus calamus TaxID=4465 RepID=A0AAV9C979_ACOCL|nr:hypothetical protein QJS10_CPB20g01061 [Acorus calamus]
MTTARKKGHFEKTTNKYSEEDIVLPDPPFPFDRSILPLHRSTGVGVGRGFRSSGAKRGRGGGGGGGGGGRGRGGVRIIQKKGWMEKLTNMSLQ